MLKFENKDNGRYYYILKEKDLFGDILVIIRGGVNYSPVRSVVCHDARYIHQQIDRLSKKRIARGYTLIQ